jgi:hypothetical protein
VGHPEIENGTPFTFAPVFTADEDLHPVVVTVVKATFSFDLQGAVWLADEQLPVNLAGEPATDARVSSYRYEPEIALSKPSTDVVLIGHAHPPDGRATHVDVGIKVGPLQKLARVFGDRYWEQTTLGIGLSRTAALGRVPLIWENAFGGRDEAGSTPEHARLEPRNPVGTGFGKPLSKNGDRLKLPNIEDPNQLIGRYGTVVTPCGFGFTSPNWEPRARLGGTYDESWSKTRKPMLPVDFDRRFFNAAAPGLVAPGYLRGNEEVVLLNTTTEPRVAFRLPNIPAPRCRVAVRGKPDVELSTNLDTVIVNADAQQVILMWRAVTEGGPHDVKAFRVVTAH